MFLIKNINTQQQPQQQQPPPPRQQPDTNNIRIERQVHSQINNNQQQHQQLSQISDQTNPISHSNNIRIGRQVHSPNSRKIRGSSLPSPERVRQQQPRSLSLPPYSSKTTNSRSPTPPSFFDENPQSSQLEQSRSLSQLPNPSSSQISSHTQSQQQSRSHSQSLSPSQPQSQSYSQSLSPQQYLTGSAPNDHSSKEYLERLEYSKKFNKDKNISSSEPFKLTPIPIHISTIICDSSILLFSFFIHKFFSEKQLTNKRLKCNAPTTILKT